jgi:hypothetical protein
MSNVHQLSNYQQRFAVVPKSSSYCDKGWVKDHRKSLDSVIAKCCVKSHIWSFLIKSATHKQYTTRYGKDQVLLHPGQLITSQAKILARFEDTASSLTPTGDHIRGATIRGLAETQEKYDDEWCGENREGRRLDW